MKTSFSSVYGDLFKVCPVGLGEFMLLEVRVGQLPVICVSSVTTVCVFGSCDLSTK